jgi:sigma-B regulation protein RsbU (phosphoserine phosphatase)
LPGDNPPRILLCTGAADGDLRLPLEEAGQIVEQRALAAAELTDPAAYDLIVVDGASGDGDALRLCRRLRALAGDDFVPTLLVAAGPGLAPRPEALEAGADACLVRPLAPGELLAQVRALMRVKDRHDRLRAKAAEAHRMNQQLEQFHQRVELEMELARRIQQGLLPRGLPEVPGVRFTVHYRPCGRVGGDFYDLFRLDESHVGFYVADAMGHGVPASLLTIFLKKGIRAKEISGRSYRLVPPEEVLQGLNHDLVEQGLAETPFITMVYGLLNFREGTLAFARAGHPHPVYVPATGASQLLEVHGSLLGVFETQFRPRAQRLNTGDKVLFYTDGADAVSFDGHPPGPRSLLAAAEHFRHLPVEEFVPRLAGELMPGEQSDDLTLLGVEALDSGQ